MIKQLNNPIVEHKQIKIRKKIHRHKQITHTHTDTAHRPHKQSRFIRQQTHEVLGAKEQKGK